MKIKSIRAKEILDSRGMPTLKAEVVSESGVYAHASVPSGASTGAHEAFERRDGDKRFMGKGVLKAVESINGPIQAALCNLDIYNQQKIDMHMIALDGTENKRNIGANAILAVSVACARCASACAGLPLYRYLGGINAWRMPGVMMNVLNGGAHADNNLDIQEFMLVPRGGLTVKEAVRMCAEIYMSLKGILKKSGLQTSVGDEGGFAPNLESDEEALSYLSKASINAGYEPGRDVFFALDMAASGWYRNGKYVLSKRGTEMNAGELIEYVSNLADRYPIVSVEDPLYEDDFDAFSEITKRLSEKCMIVGDDLFVTNPERIMRGIRAGSASAVLIKPNQIGTVTETIQACETAKRAGLRVIASHRSGDTADAFLADFSVALGADFIKSGAPARAERTEKYNRLMEISDECCIMR